MSVTLLPKSTTKKYKMSFLSNITILFLLIVFILCPDRLLSQPDTLSSYQMGGIERIKGLSYGSNHTLVLFTDSTFNYSIEAAEQISTSEGIIATGKWFLKNDTITLAETVRSTEDTRFFTSGYRETRKNMLFWFHFFECIFCFDIPPFTVYSGDTIIHTPLDIQSDALTEEEQQLKYPAYRLRARLEIDLRSADSVIIAGVTLIPEEKNDNEISFLCRPPFKTQLIKKDNGLQVIGHKLATLYFFRKIH